MTQLFSTLSRAALVAIGLGFAASASAQTDYTFTCPSGYTTSVSGGGTSSVTVTCAATGGGDVAPSCQAMTSSGGTTLTDGGSGASTTLSVLCTGGSPTSLTYNWTVPSGTKGACTASGPVGTAATCTVSQITQGGQWKVVVGNGVPSDAQKTLSYTVTQGGVGGGGDDFSACPANFQLANAAGFKYPSSGFWTNSFVSLGDGDVAVFKMAIPSTASGSKSNNWVSSTGGTKEWAITTKACDFSGATTVTGNWGAKLQKTVTGNFSFSYSIGTSSTQLKPGTTYYFNIRGVSGCIYGDCYMNAQLN